MANIITEMMLTYSDVRRTVPYSIYFTFTELLREFPSDNNQI